MRASALELEGYSRRYLTICGTQGTFNIQPLDAPSTRITLDRWPEAVAFWRGVGFRPVGPTP